MASTIPFCDPVACTAAGCDPVTCNGRAVGSNDELFDRSARAIPGGVNSSIRAFKAVGGRPYLVSRAEGARVWDVEGREMIDLVLFALAVRNLLEYRLDQRESRLWAVAALLGLGVANSYAFIGFVPMFLVAVVWILE